MVHAAIEIIKPIVTIFYCLGTPMYVQVDHLGEVDLYKYEEVPRDYMAYLGHNAAYLEAVQSEQACK